MVNCIGTTRAYGKNMTEPMFGLRRTKLSMLLRKDSR